MFKRSLYIRIVATFISVVIISLFTSYLIASFFFHEEVIFDEEVSKIASGVVEIIHLTDPENLPELVEALQTYYFNILIVTEEGHLLFGEQLPLVITENDVAFVLGSEEQAPVILPYGNREATRLVGVPIQFSNEPLALFIHLNYEDEMRTIKRVTTFSLVLVLLVGSLLIVLASRHLVNPIKKLTYAAKEMAKGNFTVRLKSKNKDEVGELISSFNHMASEVEKIDKMREDFVSSVSHEIQSPLTSIKGFTKAIRDEVVPKQNQKEYLDIIYQETERLSRLSENLLRLASLDSEHHPYNPEQYKLDEQIRRVVLATEPLWTSKSLHVSLKLAEVRVVADQDLLEQVWLNLITNAIKHSPPNGTIDIELKERKNEVSITIKDSGKGIPRESIPYLFDRFYKVDKARSSSIEGNGLGLSIVKKILLLHHFTIEVISEEGVGSIFTVTLAYNNDSKDY